MANDKSCYDKTTDDVARRYKLNPKTILSWVRNGYPLPSGNKVPLEGYLLIGRNLRFNINVIENFIYRINNEIWEFSKERTRRKMASKQVRTGIASSTLTANDSVRQLEQLIRTRR